MCRKHISSVLAAEEFLKYPFRDHINSKSEPGADSCQGSDFYIWRNRFILYYT